MKKFIYLLIGILSFQTILAQQTANIKLADLEAAFLKSNLLLLAQQYNISEQKAYKLQASLFPNPNIYIEQNIRNSITGDYFPTGGFKKPNGTNGENIFQFQQLFLLAGKRNKQIALAAINIKIAEQQFQDILRTLRYTLHSSFYNLYFLQKSLALYETEIGELDTLVKAYDIQLQKGNFAESEVVRLKAFLFQLNHESINVRLQINDLRTNLSILMGADFKNTINPIVEIDELNKIDISKLQLTQLIDSARANRPDLLIAESQQKYEKLNLSLQKAYATPDVRLGTVYDRNGSYAPSYWALNLNIDLPVFNRNQGNIKAAESRIKTSELLFKNYQQTIDKQVEEVYKKVLINNQLYKEFDSKYTQQFDKMMDGIKVNYSKRNISLLQFIDFYESYKNSVTNYNQLQFERINSIEELNYIIAIPLIN